MSFLIHNELPEKCFFTVILGGLKGAGTFTPTTQAASKSPPLLGLNVKDQASCLKCHLECILEAELQASLRKIK